MACKALLTHGRFFESSYALDLIAGWRSPDFHESRFFEIWLLLCIATFVYQGLKLPPLRLLLLLVLLHLALKHVRYVELLGLLAPLLVAASLAAQWHARQQSRQSLETVDRLFRKLAPPAGGAAIALALTLLLSATLAVFGLALGLLFAAAPWYARASS